MSQETSTSNVRAYEKLGAFYLGRRHDPASGETAREPLLYDAKDLTTHGVAIGMTGSGKTGLCVTLLEEAAIDGIPSLVVDFKGDLGNLLLTFPELRGEDFRPFIQSDEAARSGVDPDAYAAQQAELWRSGLGKWDQDGERIARLREAAEFAIYTPGSESGRPLSILSSFGAPPPAVREDGDLFQERVETATASLLSLLGIEADPIQSRETILLANLLQNAWQEGRDLDLPGLIQGIQAPPFEQVGVLPLESFYPSKERFKLAMALNNLLASPGFASWLAGTPLDVDGLLYTAEGKPRVAILTLSHLSDTERMFFVSLLLNETLAWMRTRSGTSSLRAILYIDEIFGFLPPLGNPPSKKPILTLLKQARAFGLGLLLATQNPVDLDYKALSNIGTWFLGRLQTERDRDRVLDGLQSAGGGPSRGELTRLLSGMEKRVFLLHNVHEDGPEVFKVRWAMSYLRGPLTREQIKALSADGAEEAAEPAATKPAAKVTEGEAAGEPRPVLPPGIDERFLPFAGGDGEVLYRPRLAGSARVHFIDKKHGHEISEDLFLLTPLDEDGEVDWEEADLLERLSFDDLEDEPEDGAGFGSLPGAAGEEKRYRSWSKDFSDHLYRTRRRELYESSTYDLVSEPGESERDFRLRLADTAREERDREIEKLRQKYGKKAATLGERIRKAEQRVEKEREQARSVRLESLVSVGSTLLGALMGRKRSASAAVRRVSRSFREGQDVERAEENVEALEEQLQELNAELEREIDELAERFDPQNEDLGKRVLKPRRADVDVRRVVLAWVPYRVRDEVAEVGWE